MPGPQAQVATTHQRLRSTSDPFHDLHAVYTRDTQPKPQPASQPKPPRQARKPSASRAADIPRSVYPAYASGYSAPPHRDTFRENMTDVANRASVDAPRAKMHRSQTSVPSATVTAAARPSGRISHRSLSQDSIIQQATAVEKAKTSAKPRSGKKGSAHADVIDRMDFSGVGAVFHHDSPFDACAPSRNRHRTKAPMLAWTGEPNPEDDALAKQFSPRIMDGPYAAARTPSAPAPAPYQPKYEPKKQVDAIAEAWGIHEPEPYEEFFAGGGPHAQAPQPTGGAHTSTRRNKDREVQPPMRRAVTSKLPPPKPIFDHEEEVPTDGPMSPISPGAPKRTKSLMHRIRKMREGPNAPPIEDYENLGTSPPSAENGFSDGGYRPARPTHRTQNSQGGRGFASVKLGKETSTSPTSDNSEFVHVDYDDNAGGAVNKSLPTTPPSPDAAGYFDAAGGGNGMTSPGGLGRKTSLMKKMKGVMRGGRGVSIERRK